MNSTFIALFTTASIAATAIADGPMIHPRHPDAPTTILICQEPQLTDSGLLIHVTQGGLMGGTQLVLSQRTRSAGTRSIGAAFVKDQGMLNNGHRVLVARDVALSVDLTGFNPDATAAGRIVGNFRNHSLNAALICAKPKNLR